MPECHIFDGGFECEDCTVAELVNSLATPRLARVLFATHHFHRRLQGSDTNLT
jgi:hypothetical protein